MVVDLGREEVPAGGRQDGLSSRRSVLLVHPDRFVWVGLRALLRDEPSVRIVGDVRYVADALEASVTHQPSAVIADADLPDVGIVRLAQGLRAVSPASRLMVFADKAEHDVLNALRRLDAGSYVLWHNVTPDALPLLLGAVLQAGLWVASGQAVDILAGPLGAEGAAIPLTPTERLVLDGLVIDGLSEVELAERTPVSLKVVERAVHQLKTKLHARTTCQLGARAYQLGLVGPEAVTAFRRDGEGYPSES